MKTLYSAYYQDNGYPFHKLAEEVKHALVPSDMTEEDSALVIWGGSDISPSLYNHPESKTTYPAPVRDQAEWALAKKAVAMNIPIIGVCRGAQMLCALAGGYLFQDVSGHTGSHTVKTYNGNEFVVNSIHHQMMYVPEWIPHEPLAWTTHPRSRKYIYMDDKEHPAPQKELEFVYFSSIKGFAIQWHPEMMNDDEKATKFIFGELYDRISK